MKLMLPRRNAGRSGEVDHTSEDGGTCAAEDQNAAGVPVLLHHGIERGDQRTHIKAIDQPQGLPEGFQKLLLDALHQRKAIAVMGVEGRPVQLRQLADLLDRDLVDGLFPKQGQKGFDMRDTPLGKALPQIPYKESPQLCFIQLWALISGGILLFCCRSLFAVFGHTRKSQCLQH